MLGNREAAEELVQETFLRAWRQIATYQPSLGRVSNWLLGIARNLAIDELRRRSARPQVVPNDENDEQITQIATSREEDPAELVQAAAQSAQIRQALDALPPAQREVMELAYYSGLTQSEIATRLGDPLGTVKTRMRLATQKLRDSLREINQVPQ
jgi:RNA polymerase sigma-70 factor (ECF subfamily)